MSNELTREELAAIIQRWKEFREAQDWLDNAKSNREYAEARENWKPFWRAFLPDIPRLLEHIDTLEGLLETICDWAIQPAWGQDKGPPFRCMICGTVAAHEETFRADYHQEGCLIGLAEHVLGNAGKERAAEAYSKFFER